MKNSHLPSIQKTLKKMAAMAVFGAGMLSFCQLNAQGVYVKGDFHQHSTFTDGSWTMGHVFSNENKFGLDWWANSEHGGGFNRDGRKSGTDLGKTVYWDEDSTITILGTVSMSGGHQNMWRWQSLRDYSFPMLNDLRSSFEKKLIIQGYEMNVPGHEHGSVSIVGDQLKNKKRNVNALAQFEYMFDNSDVDLTGGLAQGWIKSTAVGHAKTLEAIKWLQENYQYSSWLVPAHPERQKKYSIADFRDMNSAGPDVCFGFESMPGHQKEAGRGGYSTSAFGGTYGGCGYFAAKVGGLWDAMLSEGRGWWLFASSDFHDVAGDFYPGEYQKTYTYVCKKNNYQALYEGLRSGNSYVVTGDLIDNLTFYASEMDQFASMGGTVYLKSDHEVTIFITVHDPVGVNNNTYSSYNTPVLNHIDLIAGYVHEKYSPDAPEYMIDTVGTTKVIARFDAVGGITDSKGITSTQWVSKGNGWYYIVYNIPNVEKDMYFRLRGTNLGLNVANETDGAGNPLADALMGANDPSKAFADLWFYSNPVFVVAYKNAEFKSTEEESNTELSQNRSNITIYPNPASDVINIENQSMELLNISVFDLSGKQVKSLDSSSNQVSVKIDDLSKGVYLVTVKSATQSNTVKITKK
jgi:hypothetical protein